MNYKSFPSHYWAEIETTINSLKEQGLPLVAAFDADGTLWDTDLGENFFQYQIDHQLVPLPPDPWAQYFEMKKIDDDPRDAYVWLAQINAGVHLPQLRQWAQAAFESIQPNPIFSEQRKLIEMLQRHSVQIYIVTASIKWAVEPGARALGLMDSNVIGIETRIDGDIITNEKVFPITYRHGKVEALLKHTNGIKPFLAAGNSIGDYELLHSATHFKIAVSAASRDDKLFKSENELMTKADEHQWWRHRFI
jgi:phosphoserine phosphatase